MKKIITRIGAIFLVLGCVLALVGWVKGGKQKLLDMGPNSQISNHKATEHNLDSFKKINATLDTYNLQIKSGNEFKIQTQDLDSKLVKYSVHDKQLDLKQVGKPASLFSSNIDFSSSQQKITITVPKDKGLKSSSIHTGDGTVSLDGLTFDTLKMQLSEGDFSGKESNLKNVILNSDDGDIHFVNTKLDSLKATSSDGDFSMKNGSFQGANSILSDDGDINIHDVSDAEYHLTNNDGSNHLFGKSNDHQISSEDSNSNKVFIHNNDGDNTVK